MNTAKLENIGLQCIKFLVEYHQKYLQEEKVFDPNVEPGSVKSSLKKYVSEEGEEFSCLLQEFREKIVPKLVHWQHPSFFGYYPASISAESICGELLAAGLGINGMHWSTSPALHELEICCMDLLAKLLHLPDIFLSENGGAGGLNSGTSESAVLVLASARECKKTRFIPSEIIENGTVYCSDQAHACLKRAHLICGFQPQNFIAIPSNQDGEMDYSILVKRVELDKEEGKIPIMVVGTVGSTGACCIDDISKIGEFCKIHDIWFHVDAAYVLAAAVCNEFQFLTSGFETVTSIAFNPHKWLLTNFDCSCLWVKNRRTLTSELSPTMPIYSFGPLPDSVFELHDWQIGLGRKFRALKLWLVLHSHGVKGLKKHIYKDIHLAKLFAENIAQQDQIQFGKCSFGVVLFRVSEGDCNNKTQKLYREIMSRGIVFASSTTYKGLLWIRPAFASVNSSENNILAFSSLVISLVRELTDS